VQTGNDVIKHKTKSFARVNNQFSHNTLEDQSLSNFQDKNGNYSENKSDIQEPSNPPKDNGKKEKNDSIKNDNKEKTEAILKILNIQEKDIVTDKVTEDERRERIVETNNCGVTFDIDSGILSTYYDLSLHDTIKEPIPEKIAVANAIEFVSKLGIEVPEDYLASCDLCDKNHNSPDTEWHVRFQYKYKNIPILYSYLYVLINSNDGSVSSLIYAPVRDYPNSMIQNYSEDYAIKIAKDFLQTKYPDEYYLHRTELGIIYPNNRYQQDDSSVYQENPMPRLCWIVVCRNKIGNLMYAVYIDTETGKVIGGL